MIKRYKAFELLEQINTDQGPVYSICIKDDNFEKFYVKYIYRENHFDCLVYEILLTRLANYFGLNTPEIALIDVPLDIFEDVIVNNRFFYNGIIGFGSKDLSRTILLVDELELNNKHDFNRYANPSDVIKILLLDLHCHNRDRKDVNFNILVDTANFGLFVFDHYDCFGGTSQVGQIDPSTEFHLSGTIYRSNFFRSFCKWLEAEEIKESFDSYLELADNSEDIETIVEDCIAGIPDEWDISDSLEEDLKAYLTDPDRLERLESIYSDILRLKQRQL